jgi:hypothetical protein
VIRSLAAVCIAVAASATEVAAQATDYTVIGVGASSCGSWIIAHRPPVSADARLMEQWVLGFLSGIGYIVLDKGDDPLRTVDAGAVVAWVDNFCRSNPLKLIVDAGQIFYAAHPR